MSRSRTVRGCGGRFRRQTTERRATVCWTWASTRIAVELRRKKNRRGIRVEQNFPRIETVSVFRVVRAFDAIGVECGAAKDVCRNAAMPNPSRFVSRMLKTKFKQRFRRVRLAVEQQRDASGISRVDGEIESVFCLQLLHSGW